jgi:hypothetical protein
MAGVPDDLLASTADDAGSSTDPRSRGLRLRAPRPRLRGGPRASPDTTPRGANPRLPYALARPLFDRYPRSVAVQDLRCQLATLRYLAKDTLQRECALYVQLADAGTAGGR